MRTDVVTCAIIRRNSGAALKLSHSYFRCGFMCNCCVQLLLHATRCDNCRLSDMLEIIVR